MVYNVIKCKVSKLTVAICIPKSLQLAFDFRNHQVHLNLFIEKSAKLQLGTEILLICRDESLQCLIVRVLSIFRHEYRLGLLLLLNICTLVLLILMFS